MNKNPNMIFLLNQRMGHQPGGTGLPTELVTPDSHHGPAEHASCRAGTQFR